MGDAGDIGLAGDAGDIGVGGVAGVAADTGDGAEAGVGGVGGVGGVAAVLGEPDVSAEPEVFAEPDVSAEPEVFAEPDVFAEPEVLAEPEVSVEAAERPRCVKLSSLMADGLTLAAAGSGATAVRAPWVAAVEWMPVPRSDESSKTWLSATAAPAPTATTPRDPVMVQNLWFIIVVAPHAGTV
ncbi:hypothetical protein [Arthrobacter sp. KK5.5]|uniref:hypothetical protein n=1 Tax=Arthrobacter sp. KK5.5 TaxID=3373084 RepID=UPI003EE4AA6B